VFEPEIEFGINPLEAGITWQKLAKPFGVSDFVVSERDKEHPTFSESGKLLFA